MNCKPGELAVIVNDPCCGQADLGKLVRVLHLADDSAPGCPEWVCDTLGQSIAAATLGWNKSLRHLIDIPDSWLRPIRDPGDDTRDNAWDWLPPVPNDISAEDPQDLREALKQWAEEQR